MLSLDVARVRRCTTNPHRTTTHRSSNDLSSTIPSSSSRRYNRIHVPYAISSKRPSPRLKDRTNDHLFQSLMSQVTVMRPRLLKGITKEEALAHLDVINDALDYPLTHIELIELSEALGLVVARSPMTPSDIEFPSIVDRLTHATEHRLSEFSTMELCKLVWAYGCFGPSVLQSRFQGVKQLISQICLRLESDRVPSLAMTVLLFHGLQKMKFSGHGATTHQILRRMGPVLKYSDTGMNEMAKLVLLAGKLRVESGHQFLRQAGRAAKHRMREFSDSGLRDFVSGFVFYDIAMMPALFDALTVEVQYRSAMAVSTRIQITLALSKIQYRPSNDYLECFRTSVLKDLEQLTPKDVACCLQAMGQLDMSYPDLIEAMRHQFQRLSSAMLSMEVCHGLLGFVRLQSLDETSLTLGLSSVHKELVNGVSKMQRLILHQILTHAKLFLEMDVIPNDIFPTVWQGACRDAWIKDQQRSAYEEEASILKTVQALGLKWKVVTSEIGDIRILVIDPPYGSRPVVLDVVYRKKHCFINQQGRPEPLPWKQWQWRVLRRQGYEVLWMNEAEWMQVPKESKLRHLGTKLGFWKQEALMDMEYRLGMRK